MRRYFGRKLAIYVLTFVVAVTLNWIIPRFMPGDPVLRMLTRTSVSNPEAIAPMRAYYENVFGLDVPLWKQYVNYWLELFQGNLGVSVWLFPAPVADVIVRAVPYTLALLLPSILLSWWAGNKVGALAARRRWLDNTALPVSYALTATPYMWLGILLAWSLGIVAGVFPVAGGYSFELRPAWSWTFAASLAQHWFLPFLSLFLVAFGGWAIGMRNLIIYELEADYASYLAALGAPRRLIRRYAFRNALLPQLTGLALQLGVLVAGALVTEIVFAYPGLGHLILQAIQNQDFFLLQGAFLFIVIGVLVANFVIDVVYVLVDPRTRTGMQGAT
ncbi:ABC transporter permease [Asanoa sp. WMMD1127]|uniref:ABC transporter permease n=1 Tax=Asanoa sp. WMMD1127 TaxID=3016107 RepID=UPI0024171551|nr:ABC transporter permease [Asanoa sp. WMMD1127]MDG4823480.1 ABC transporter permease [Asanoa sp. WMMD1127]